MINWHWDITPDTPLAFVDFETASRVNLREVGSHCYVRDRSTRLLSAVWKTSSGTVTWCPGLTHSLPDVLTSSAVPREVEELASSHVWIAHNAEGFDAMLWERLYPDVTPRWADSMHLCRIAGIPASLDGAAKKFGLPGKDAEGAKVMQMMTKRPDAVGTIPLWSKLLHYNTQDVEQLASVWERLTVAVPQEVLALHSAINERGVKVDRAFAESLHRVWIETKCAARDEIAEATGGKLTREKASSGPAVHAWLKSVGVSVSSLRRDYLATILDDPDSLCDGDNETAALVAHVLKLRADVVRAGEGKVSRLIETLDDDDRLRRMFVFHGATTGRFSSRVVQVHNLPRGVDGVDVESLTATPLTREAVTHAATESGNSISDVLASLVRPCFVAESGKQLCIADFASIEARCVAWMAGEDSLLRIFSSGGDVYCDMASRLYGREITKNDKSERRVGKTTILGAGYQMAGANFARVCKTQRINLEAAGVTAEQCIKTYREQYPRIPAMWKGLNDAAFATVQSGGVTELCRVKFSMRGLDLVMTLPSGRDLIYRDARIVTKIPRWAILTNQMHVPPRSCLEYTHPHGYAKDLYGGILTENASQAICRDLMVESALRYDANRPGELVLHVHDELVAESVEPEVAIHELCREMSVAPAWAAGFPIEVEGFTSPRYVKSPFSGSTVAHYRGGVAV